MPPWDGLCPAQIDDLRHGILRQHYVQAAIPRWMHVGKLIADQESLASNNCEFALMIRYHDSESYRIGQESCAARLQY